MAPTFDVQAIRKQFPALGKRQIYFDNAGGSQVLQSVVDSISDYLLSNNVQLGASYPISQASTKLFDDGCKAVATYINAAPSEVVLGPSTTQLFRNLSLSLYDYIQPDDEIIISKLDHEANIASWLTLAKWKNAKVIWWDSPHSQTNPTLEPSHLKTLMTPKTKLVTCTHTSNILGTISPIQKIAEIVHAFPSALLCVDAVAYAPHAPIDVKALGVDFYCFSWYKIFGPHIASMYASTTAQKHLTTLGHFFKPTHSLENLLGLAAANYELVASVPKVVGYLETVSWEAIEAQEERLQGILIGYLLSKPETYQIYGVPGADRKLRHPTVGFLVQGWRSREVVERVEERSEYGCRWGSFYSNRLAKEVMGIDDGDGVVRVSLLHYNTEEEVRGFVKVLDEIVFGGK